jgi:hypothetical protein
MWKRKSLAYRVDKILHDELVGNGFELTEGTVDKRVFGNEIATYESASMRLCFVTDRGDLIVEIRATDPESEWFPVWRLLEFLGHKEEEFRGDIDCMITSVGGALFREFGLVAAMLSEGSLPETRRRMRDLTKALIDRINRGM